MAMNKKTKDAHGERRNYRRVNLKDSERLTGTLCGTGKVSFSMPCMISEISMAGLKLSIDNTLTFSNGKTLTLRGLETTSGNTINGNILLEVGWCYDNADSEQTVYGCRFITISRKAQEGIAVLIQQHTAEQISE